MKTFLTLAMLSVSTAFLAAQPSLKFEKDGQPLTIEERMAQEKTQGVTMVAMLDGEVVLNDAWGWRERETQSPANENTLFQIGSMSQPLTQLAILQLVDRGVLDLDTDINQYLRSWQFPVSKLTEERPITLRQLMLQTRGIKFPYKPKGYAAGSTLPTHLQLLNGESPAKNPAVKLKSDLNKSGNNSFAPALIMQQILMDHYELSFPELMKQYVFTPLKMENSFYAAEPTAEQQENIAIGYDDNNQPMPDGFLRFPELAASGMYSTAYDYALFIQAIFDAVDGKAGAILSQPLAKEAVTPESDEEVLLFGRGDGIYFWGGATKGYYCQFEADATDRRWLVVAFSNDNINWSFNRELRNAAAEYARSRMSR
ncbi:MAG: serine hydrolase domain-containing protein [Bacteroidota bacterium]